MYHVQGCCGCLALEKREADGTLACGLARSFHQGTQDALLGAGCGEQVVGKWKERGMGPYAPQHTKRHVPLPLCPLWASHQ